MERSARLCESRVSLVDRPGAARGQFAEMPVGIAEVNAFTAELPVDAPLDFHAAAGELLFPRAKFRAFDRKGEVNFAGTAERRNGAAGKHIRLRIFFAAEKQKDLPAVDRVGAEACVTRDDPQTEDIFVEFGGTLEVVHVKSGFENTGEGRHDEPP